MDIRRTGRRVALVAGIGLAALFAGATCRAQTPDIVLADFEGAGYGAWQTAGTAFGSGPACGAIDGQRPVDGFLGKGCANSFHGADAPTGTLTSPPFRIERRFVAFLIGGGAYSGKTCASLLVDGKAARTATGDGTETLRLAAWNVADLAGQVARFQVVDGATGSMGHVMVDQVIETDRAGLPIANVLRELVATRRYLNIPMASHGENRALTLMVDGRPVSAFSQFTAPLADGKPDWWASYDISRWKGRKLGLLASRLPDGSGALERIEQADAPKGARDAYQHPLRPQLHFSPLRGGCGDANGLVYYRGEYHLFFQHNPFGQDGGYNSHWGHAISKDLVHWRQMPDAIYPSDLGLAYSGSAVVDEGNTSGLATGKEKPIVLCHASAGHTFSQSIAYSNDRGRTFTPYAGNPVLPFVEGGNRDPRVLWYAPERKWVMVVAFGNCSRNMGGAPSTNPNYGLLSSKDLKRWQRMSSVYIDDTADCPEFFEIAVDGDPKHTKWVIYSGDAYYLVGSFDGTTFRAEGSQQKLNLGNAFYASQTFSGIPARDGRRILMAHTTGGGDYAGFWGGIGLPAELTLRDTDEGLRLFATPARELKKLRRRTVAIAPQPIAPGSPVAAGIGAELLEVEADLEVGSATRITLDLRGTTVAYDAARQALVCGDRTAPLRPIDGRVRIRAYVDRTDVTLFANDGRIYMPMAAVPSPGNRSVTLSAESGEARIHSLRVHELRSIWEGGRR